MSEPSWPPAQWPPDPGRAGRARPGPSLDLPAGAGRGARRGAVPRPPRRRGRAEQGEPAAPSAPRRCRSSRRWCRCAGRRPPSPRRGQRGARGLPGPVGDRVAPGSCLVVGVDGAPVFDDAGGDQRVPASNMKLVTAAVALDVLGPDHRFTTEALADAPPGRWRRRRRPLPGRGRRPGAGHGPYLAAAAAQVDAPAAVRHAAGGAGRPDRRRRGHRITGSVLGDDSRYDAERFVPSWPASYADVARGRPARRAAGQRRRGHARRRCAAPPTRRCRGRRLDQLLRDRGWPSRASPAGRWRRRRAGGHRRIQSRPLCELVGELLTTSDDNTAELLVKEIGAAAGGGGTRRRRPGRGPGEAGGVGVPLDGIILVDGSGLDRGNRLTCRRCRRCSPRRRHRAVADGLPIAGQTGTLATSSPGNPPTGRLRAKTGTLARRQGAVRLRRRRDGSRHVSFSFIQNGPERGDRGDRRSGMPSAGR